MKNSELIINDDGSVYHIKLKPEHVADTVILVGDPGRVGRISKYFDDVEYKISNREFHTHTGTYKGKRLTVLATGIGCDNIDIVMTELDAAVNFDLSTCKPKAERKSLNLIRIGTSGALHEDVPVGSFVLASHGLGFEGLVYYYPIEFSASEQVLMDEINNHLQWKKNLSKPYLIEASSDLVSLLQDGMIKGITATASGFYGPQGRKVHLSPAMEDINSKLSSFQSGEHRIINFEMETSALYGMSKMLGHHCVTCCAVIANRSRQEYSDDHKAIVDRLIQTVLEKIVS